MAVGEAMPATGNSGRIESNAGDGDSLSGFCANVNRLPVLRAEVQRIICEGSVCLKKWEYVCAFRWRMPNGGALQVELGCGPRGSVRGSNRGWGLDAEALFRVVPLAAVAQCGGTRYR